jgi:hypothetical protein
MGSQGVVVSKNGTNQFHGDAFEYLRNSSLDAKNFFLTSQPIPLFQKNRFGAAFGGPIKKDKTDFSGRISQATRYLESFPSKRLLSIPIVPI